MYKTTDIPIGRENAISRRALALLWNCDDRTARARVARLRRKPCEDGMFICSHSCGGVHGYYRTSNPEEIRHFILESRKRISSTAEPMENARRLLKSIEAKQSYGKGIAG